MRAHLIVAGLTVALCAPLSARAADPTRARVDEMADLSKDALEYAKKGDFETARKLYAKAWDTYPNSPVLFNLALAELKSGLYVDAIQHFDTYLAQSDAEPAKADAIKSKLRPQAFAATGHAKIEDATLAGAAVSIDGRDVGRRTLLDMPPGDHVIVARPENGPAWRAKVTVAAGQTVAPHFELLPNIPQLTHDYGAGSGAAGNGADHPSATPPAPEEQRWTAREYTALATLGAGVLAVGGAAVFFGLGTADATHARHLEYQLAPYSCGAPIPSAKAADCTELQNTKDERDRFLNAATGLVIGAGVAAAATYVVLLAWPKNAPGKAAVVPMFDPTTRMGSVVGRLVF